MLKAITLYQPWASLIALGYKTVETRGWPTQYRGPLLIHAGAHIDSEAFQSFRGLLTAPILPCGQLIAIVTLHDCKPVEKLTPDRFGDYSPGRFGWILTDLKRLENPVLCRGYQRLWNVPEAKITEEIRNALASQQPSGPTGG